MVGIPKTRYAKAADGTHIAYATLGGGPIDLVGIEPSEMLATQTVRGLTVGSGLWFEDAGEHELKGVPDHRRLYRVVA